MSVRRFIIYAAIAIVGFLIGSGFYMLGSFIGRVVESYLSEVLGGLLVNPEVRNTFISGIIGMILAVILAYIWAKT